MGIQELIDYLKTTPAVFTLVQGAAIRDADGYCPICSAAYHKGLRTEFSNRYPNYKAFQAAAALGMSGYVASRVVAAADGVYTDSEVDARVALLQLIK